MTKANTRPMRKRLALASARGLPQTAIDLSRPRVDLSRGVLFSWMVLAGFANAICKIVVASVNSSGMTEALAGTFGISVLLWGAAVAVVVTLRRLPAAAVDRRDILACAVAGALILLPTEKTSWLALCVIAGHLLVSGRDDQTRRAAMLVFALTIPLLWSRILFACFSGTILHLDALLVGWIIGVQAVGNVVPLPDGTGQVFIAPGCSSLANVSLAFLTATIFVGLRRARWTRSDILWTLTSAAAVIAVNVTRVSLIGLFPHYYERLHGQPGSEIANLAITAAILLIGYHKIGREPATTLSLSAR